MRKRTGTSRRGKPDVSKEASKPCWTADLDPHLLTCLRKLGKEERKEIGALITTACEAFGQPHRHAGVGVRALGHDLYECRHGIKLRMVFQRVAERGLYFHMLGTHDEVKRFLKSHS